MITEQTQSLVQIINAEMNKSQKEEILDDGTIIKTTVYTYPNKVITTVESFPPEETQKEIDSLTEQIDTLSLKLEQKQRVLIDIKPISPIKPIEDLKQ